MEIKAFECKVEQADIEAREVTGISAVIGNIDDGYDIIHRGAFKKTIQEQKERVRHLWQHDWENPPIATILDLREVGKGDLPKSLKEKYPEAKGGLLVKRKYLNTPRADEVFAGLISDPPAISEMSIGYSPVKYDFEEVELADGKSIVVRNLRELRLWDTSDVVWGMNAATVADSSKSVLPYQDTGKAEDSAVWDHPMLSDFTDADNFDDLSDGEKSRIAAHFGFVKKNPPESFDDLMLPHHQPSKTGVGPVVLNGLIACVDALIAVDLSKSLMSRKDHEAIYDHLRKHFEHFDYEPPLMEVLTLIKAATDVGKVLSDENAQVSFDRLEVSQMLVKLTRLLRAESHDVSHALTQQKAMQYEHELRKRQLLMLSLRT